ESERPLGAWFAHWLGYALQRAGDMESAVSRYREAARVKSELGFPADDPVLPAATAPISRSAQSSRMADLLSTRGVTRVRSDLGKVASDLQSAESSAGVHEEAIRMLGEYLGYDAWRGDIKTNGKAHDDIWEEPDGSRVLCFDAKTKKGASRYSKEYIGQSAQHAIWAEKKFGDATLLLFLVGPAVAATPQATPPAGIRVVTPQE